MNSTNKKIIIDVPASSTSAKTTRRPWQSPDIEEVDFTETQVTTSGSGTDTANWS